MVRRLLAMPLALLALTTTAPSAGAIDGAQLQQVLGREMARVSSASGAFVRDLETGEVLFARRARTPRIPASVEKLLVTSVALRELGPQSTLRTTLLGAGALDAGGVWRGDLVLRGAGDPALSTTSLTALARRVADETGIRRVDGSVLGDESAFDLLRGSSRTLGAYDRDMGGVLSALAVGRGFSRHGRPALEAARRFARALRAAGVRVDGRTAEGTASEGAAELAAHDSPPLRTIAAAINTPSNNFAAEMVLKGLGARFGAGGTTIAGADVVERELGELGVRAAVSDGSGLARANRISPAEVVDLLGALHDDPVAGEAFTASLPVAGRTGTLRLRLRRTAAAGRCRAKTGTLRAVSALAGFCVTRDRGTVAFGFLMNATSVSAARRAQDRMAVALARYDG